MFYYILYRLGHLLACILPLWTSYGLAEFFSYLQYLIAKKDRHAVIENLKIIYGGDDKKAKMDAYKVFKSFGLYLVDFFRFSKITKQFIENYIEIRGTEHLNNAIKENRGVIAVTGHIGNWEMGGVVMSVLGYNISAVALVHNYKKINDFFLRQREEKGLKIIPVGSSTKRCVSVLRQKNILALLGDRDFSDTGIPVMFFGKQTYIPKGPALLSLKLNSPIIPGFFLRKDKYRYELIFGPPIKIEVHEDFQKALKVLTEKIIEVLEKYIRLYPTQWLMFRPFWETPTDLFIL